ncbi:MAG TPA: methyltransferase domain-containing protein [Jatrophihabitantaceae bacterium]
MHDHHADPPTSASTLPLTGERTVPGIWHENYWFRRHEAAYEALLPHLRGQLVLEIGCGEGYGAALMATVARRVIGLDYDERTIEHAAATYPQAAFLRANLAALPVRESAFDAVASLQVIEHVWDHEHFLGECARTLRPGGMLIVTTPNRLTLSPGPDVPANPFHAHEFVADELVGLVERCGVEVVDVLGLHAGGWLRALDAAHGGSFAGAQLAAPPQEWSAGLARDVAAVRTADFRVSGERLDACLDLVVIARRPQ